MLTRIHEATRASLKSLAADPEYGTLRNMFDRLFEEFLEARPYKQKGFMWSRPAAKGTTGWVAFNVVCNNRVARWVKAEAVKLNISLTMYLYTALIWQLDRYQIPNLHN